MVCNPLRMGLRVATDCRYHAQPVACIAAFHCSWTFKTSSDDRHTCERSRSPNATVSDLEAVHVVAPAKKQHPLSADRKADHEIPHRGAVDPFARWMLPPGSVSGWLAPAPSNRGCAFSTSITLASQAVEIDISLQARRVEANERIDSHPHDSIRKRSPVGPTSLDERDAVPDGDAVSWRRGCLQS